ncbi:hypothetical protein [Aliarcobacter butzleri]|uniref:hypothetical protein n=1 Tax=Aliarcobacter butzleri TaxID=28197 RepID=UPI000A6E035F
MIVKRSILWKIYLLLLGILLFTFLLSFYKEEQLLFLESNIFSNVYVGLIYLIYFISLLGIWGFVYQKKVFYQEFWIYIFFIIIVDFIGSLIGPTIETSTQEIDFLSTILGLLFLVLGFFYFYALYQYAFKMKYLWSEDD